MSDIKDKNSNTVIVLDFETTGLSPDYGDRAIEIGAVKIVNGKITESFQQLMNPGKRVNSFIEGYTGITNAMLNKALPVKEVMEDFYDFIQGYNLVAHNASFDSRFLDAEFKLIKKEQQQEFACSMLVARRIYQSAPNHKLGTLVSYKDLPNDGTFHRALADAEMTAHLWLALLDDIKDKHAFDNIPFKVMQQLGRTAKASAKSFLCREALKNK